MGDILAERGELDNAEDGSLNLGIFFGKGGEVHVIHFYRGDMRGPSEIFPQGFVARGKDTKLLAHLRFNPENSAYISTSTSKHIAETYSAPNGFVYEISPQANAINIEEILVTKYPKKLQLKAFVSGEQEMAVPFKINTKDIKGTWPMQFKTRGEIRSFNLGKYIPNPYYVATPAVRLARIAKTLKIVGYGATGVGVAIDGANLYFAYHEGQLTNNFEKFLDEGVKTLGGWSGAIAFGSACGKAGAACLTAPGASLAAGVVAGVAGSVAGYHVCAKAAQQIKKDGFNPLSLFIPAIFSSQLHGAEPEEAAAEVNQEIFDSTKDYFFDILRDPRVNVPRQLNEFAENLNPLATFVKHLRADEKAYPNASAGEHKTAAMAQTIVEEGLKKGAEVAGMVAGEIYGGPTGAKMGTLAAHKFIQPIAKAAGHAANAAVHEGYNHFQYKPSNTNQVTLDQIKMIYTSAVTQARTIAAPSYTTALTSFLDQTETKLKTYRGAFNSFNMQESKPTVSKPVVKRTKATESSSFSIRVGPMFWGLLDTVSAAEWPDHEFYGSQPAPQSQSVAEQAYRAAYRQAMTDAGTKKSSTMPVKKTITHAPTTQPKPQAPRATDLATMRLNKTGVGLRETDLATLRLNKAGVEKLRSSVQDLTTTLQTTKLDYATPQGRLTAQEFATTLGTIGGAFADAGTIALHFGGGATARRIIAIGGNVAQIASSISSIIAAKAAISAAGMLTASAAFSIVTAGLSLVTGVVALMGSLFGDDDNSAEILAAALVEVRADLHALKEELRAEIRSLGRELQNEVRTLGAMMNQVMINDGIIYHEVQHLVTSIHELKLQLREHIQTSNAELKALSQSDLRKASSHVQQYMAGSAIASSDEAISESLRELDFWLASELQSSVHTEAMFAEVSAEHMVAILNQYKSAGRSMPGAFAARLNYHFGDVIDECYTKLPELELYHKTANLFLLGLKQAELNYQNQYTSILDTTKSSLAFVVALKNNTALCQSMFAAYHSCRNHVAKIVTQANACYSGQLIQDMARSPLNTQFRSALFAMEEQRLLLETLAGYVDGCFAGDLTQRVLALDSATSICQQPQRLLSVPQDKLALTVASPAPETISYERALTELLAKIEKADFELKKSFADAEEKVQKLLEQRTKMFLEDEGLDPAVFCWRKAVGPDANPRGRILSTAHFDVKQKYEFITLLNKQDKTYNASSIRIEDEKCIVVQLPECVSKKKLRFS